MTREATLCPNILYTIRIFPRISKFLSFHETKQTQSEVDRFFSNFAEFVFEYFFDSWRILASFAKSFSNRFSQHDRTVERVPVASSSAHRAPLPLPHSFCIDTTNLYQIFSQISQNLANTLQVLTRDISFPRGDRASSDANQGRGLEKFIVPISMCGRGMGA